MPRNARPSWIRVKVEGRKHDVATGPKRKSGCMRASFDVRHMGAVSTNKVTVMLLPNELATTTLLLVCVNGQKIHEEEIKQ